MSVVIVFNGNSMRNANCGNSSNSHCSNMDNKCNSNSLASSASHRSSFNMTVLNKHSIGKDDDDDSHIVSDINYNVDDDSHKVRDSSHNVRNDIHEISDDSSYVSRRNYSQDIPSRCSLRSSPIYSENNVAIATTSRKGNKKFGNPGNSAQTVVQGRRMGNVGYRRGNRNQHANRNRDHQAFRSKSVISNQKAGDSVAVNTRSNWHQKIGSKKYFLMLIIHFILIIGLIMSSSNAVVDTGQ